MNDLIIEICGVVMALLFLCFIIMVFVFCIYYEFVSRKKKDAYFNQLNDEQKLTVSNYLRVQVDWSDLFHKKEKVKNEDK